MNGLTEREAAVTRATRGIKRLDIADFGDCILGQLYGSYQTGMIGLGLRDSGAPWGFDFGTTPHGMLHDGVNVSAEAQNEAWRELLAR